MASVWGECLANGINASADQTFEDDFQPASTKLPDSQEYLATLEGKLNRLRSQKSKGDLVRNLELTRQSYMLRLLQRDSTATFASPPSAEIDLEEPIEVSELLRRVAPEQALNSGELSSTMTNLWSKKTCLLITGASRGIGRTIAVEFSKRLAPQSLIILTARNLEKLQETKDLLDNSKLEVRLHSIDLENAVESDLASVGTVENPETYEQCIVVHNAGSMGNLSKWSLQLDNLKELQGYFNTNLFSMILLNNLFLNKFSSSTSRLVINITSLWAIQASKNFVLYCVGKAAREMFVKVLAEENPDVRVLSYSPGPVTTDMADEVLHGIRDPAIKAKFMELRSTGQYLTTEQTVARLVAVLEDNKFEQAQHVDYFDA
ncbi:hypothetical protein B566_EDAN015369 [Ephemera danica]|nr:hypothetical protein B566_EDAN015369 [Ephemera danica]